MKEIKKYENFCSAYDNLLQAAQINPPYDTVTLTGIVALFQIAFEQSWKMIKSILEEHGYPESATGSPRLIIKTAYESSMISDDKAWIMALNARNNASHAYNKKVAEGIICETKEIYLKMFADLKRTIEKNWLNSL